MKRGRKPWTRDTPPALTAIRNMMNLFSFSYPNVWDALRQSELPIVLYGMGNGADKVLDAFEKYHIKTYGVMASDDFCRYQEFRGFTVKKQSDFERELGDFIVALCFGSSLPEVTAHILEVAKTHIVLVPNVPVVGDVLMDEDFIRRYHEDIERAYTLLTDEQSRKVFKGALSFYYTGRLEFLTAIESDKDEVFRDILRLNNENYLDLGAYRGDTVDEFLYYCQNYRHITAVEPNPKNYQKLTQHIENLENAFALNAGIAGRVTTMRISKKAGRMPTLGDEDGIEIPVTTVDEIDCQPTYIKIDIEGMESEMLSGAEHTLRAYKPKLNLAAYHRTEDFFELILQLHEINSAYNIYLRKHPYIPCWDLNIYAI